jgi:hypothetical protein
VQAQQGHGRLECVALASEANWLSTNKTLHKIVQTDFIASILLDAATF